MFKPKADYLIQSKSYPIEDFHRYKDEFVTRPPYQRKAVWSQKKKQQLLDSLFRGYYIPKLVLREIKVADNKVLHEVVDGQQRITTVQDFFENKVKLPNSLGDLDTRLPKKYYSELDVELRKFVDRILEYDADRILQIDDPKSAKHQKIATEIFWRLQQGESLNFMEVAHARLSSTVRIFLVNFSDDISFDYENYKAIDENKNKHSFFKLIQRKNDRMQHLSLMGRMLLVELADGPTDIRDSKLADLIDETKIKDGVGNLDYKDSNAAKNLLRTLNLLSEIFGKDTMLDERNGVKELSVEYFILSVFILIRYLQNNYVVQDSEKETIRNFVLSFYQRWKKHSNDDRDIISFSDSRQQASIDLENRDRIIRQSFFSYLRENKLEMQTKDEKRTFNEFDKIFIYRRDDGRCQECIKEGKPDKETIVSWTKYQADHIKPWVKGGKTKVENAQVLCVSHNAAKGAN